jgi:hypothetical protein
VPLLELLPFRDSGRIFGLSTESILEPGPGTPTLFFFILGIAGTGFGCYLIWP